MVSKSLRKLAGLVFLLLFFGALVTLLWHSLTAEGTRENKNVTTYALSHGFSSVSKIDYVSSERYTCTKYISSKNFIPYYVTGNDANGHQMTKKICLNILNTGLTYIP